MVGETLVLDPVSHVSASPEIVTVAE
jgi:hypothetical protein